MKTAYVLNVYQDSKFEWRWRLTSANGNILADSAEGYDSRSNAIRAARRLAFVAMVARVSP